MKRIAITLILSVIVFVATIVATDMYVSTKSIQVADTYNAVALDAFRSELNSDILLTEQCARSFLTGIISISLASDSSTIVVDEKRLIELKSGVYDILCEFMKANRYYENSMFIIDRDVCNEYFGMDGCFAPSIQQGDTTRYDLSHQYDFMNAIHYKEVKASGRKLWSAPVATSPVAGKYMTLYLPLMLSNGKFFGTFAVSLDVKMINEKLRLHLPYRAHSAMFLADEDDNIFSSYPEWIMQSGNDVNVNTGVYLRGADYKKTDHQIYTFEGVEYYVYQRDGLLAPWRIFTICEVDAIYEDTRQFIIIIFTTSLIGMLLMLVCCVVISRQIRKNLLLKAAAEDELKMAAKVQTSLLKSITHKSALATLHAFMCPAKEAGGDLYDYMEKDGKLIFCIGDVSGKGMPAALFMTQVVSLFRNAVRNSYDPACIACQINEVLAENNPDMTFCTFFVGVLSEDKLIYCNAGHNPPVLIPDKSLPKYLQVKPNVALGLMEGFPYRSETLLLSSGDSLLFYTDGVTEAKNRSHAEYGQQRLLAILSQATDDIIPPVLDDLHAFVGKYEQTDDITMLSLSMG